MPQPETKLTRKQQAELTRQKLTESIMILMDTTSYHQLTVDQICQHAGVSKGTFYHYFTSKRDILTHICQGANARIISELHFDETLSAQELFDQYLQVITRATYREGYAAEARMLIALLTSGCGESSDNSIQPQIDYVMRILAHGKARGEIPSGVDPEQMNLLITAAIQGFVTIWSISQGTIDLGGLLHSAFTPIWQLISSDGRIV